MPCPASAHMLGKSSNFGRREGKLGNQWRQILAENSERRGQRRRSRWRVAGWGIAAFVLLLPFLAMRTTSEVSWDGTDFIVLAMMLAIAGGTLELGARLSPSWVYRGAYAIAVAAGFLLVWVNLAVGFLGDEDNPANLMFLAVLAVAIGGAIVARGRAGGMSRAMAAGAIVQLAVALIALGAGLASPGLKGLHEVAMGTILFGALWLASARLFRREAT